MPTVTFDRSEGWQALTTALLAMLQALDSGKSVSVTIED